MESEKAEKDSEFEHRVPESIERALASVELALENVREALGSVSGKEQAGATGEDQNPADDQAGKEEMEVSKDKVEDGNRKEETLEENADLSLRDAPNRESASPPSEAEFDDDSCQLCSDSESETTSTTTTAEERLTKKKLKKKKKRSAVFKQSEDHESEVEISNLNAKIESNEDVEGAAELRKEREEENVSKKTETEKPSDLIESNQNHESADATEGDVLEMSADEQSQAADDDVWLEDPDLRPVEAEEVSKVAVETSTEAAEAAIEATATTVDNFDAEKEKAIATYDANIMDADVITSTADVITTDSVTISTTDSATTVDVITPANSESSASHETTASNDDLNVTYETTLAGAANEDAKIASVVEVTISLDDIIATSVANDETAATVDDTLVNEPLVSTDGTADDTVAAEGTNSTADDVAPTDALESMSTTSDVPNCATEQSREIKDKVVQADPVHRNEQVVDDQGEAVAEAESCQDLESTADQLEETEVIQQDSRNQDHTDQVMIHQDTAHGGSLESNNETLADPDTDLLARTEQSKADAVEDNVDQGGCDDIRTEDQRQLEVSKHEEEKIVDPCEQSGESKKDQSIIEVIESSQGYSELVDSSVKEKVDTTQETTEDHPISVCPEKVSGDPDVVQEETTKVKVAEESAADNTNHEDAKVLGDEEEESKDGTNCDAEHTSQPPDQQDPDPREEWIKEKNSRLAETNVEFQENNESRIDQVALLSDVGHQELIPVDQPVEMNTGFVGLAEASEADVELPVEVENVSKPEDQSDSPQGSML